ncbi:MAG: site-specific integrase, partial [Synechococcaceae bacterium WB9_2_170]|nr:site-specific integrase [Synechococcaceae bacterium WB9_2_170]
LEADCEHELRLAVGLVGLYGLRPAELAVLQVGEDGKGRVGQVKRNTTNMGAKAKPPRRLHALDIAGREGEGDRLLQLYASGLVKLPKSIRNQIAAVEVKNRFQDVGREFAQLLRRYGPWRALVARRIAAALMGHNTATHLRHYGAWTDEAGLEAAVERFNQGVLTGT